MAEREDFTKVEEHLLAGKCGIDAHKWAMAFCQLAEKNNFDATDESLMLGWFANAIEQARPVTLTEEAALGIAARIWCRPETSHLEMDTVLAQGFADVLQNGESQ